MVKRRQSVPVSLTPQQRRELEKLWFYWGNYGPKTTKGNHSFIQVRPVEEMSAQTSDSNKGRRVVS